MLASANSTFMGVQLRSSTTSTMRSPAAARVQAPITAILKTKAPSKAQTTKGKTTKQVAGQTFKVTVGVDKDGKLKKAPVTLGFTKDNELFVGRAAMIGFAASLIGEVITGKGAIAQLGLETGLPLAEIDGFILALIAFNFVAAVAPTSGRFKPQEDFADRKGGPAEDPNRTIFDPKFWGIPGGFGFSKANELFVGRLAQIGFAASLLGEGLTGKGILGQIGLETGIPIYEAEPLLLFSILFTLFAAVNPGSGTFEYDQEE